MEAVMRPDPFDQFAIWFREAQAVTPKYPEAMTLATADKDGRPSARIVLFKGFNEGGFSFFTNYDSRKGKELLGNPFAALVFYWAALDRQVRIEGRIEKLSQEDSLAYFHSRPRESQISAWASPQSREITGRQFLDERIEEIRRRFEGQDVPLPAFWGGFRLVPEKFEFWVELPSRRHDRFLYTRQGSSWKTVQLGP
jgi:pyridoxamine 5'-phosphate oxidase